MHGARKHRSLVVRAALLPLIWLVGSSSGQARRPLSWRRVPCSATLEGGPLDGYELVVFRASELLCITRRVLPCDGDQDGHPFSDESTYRLSQESGDGGRFGDVTLRYMHVGTRRVVRL
jgi:hypothetical protein